MPLFLSKGAIALRTWRKERDLTQAKARVMLGLPYDSILSRLENGGRPSLEIAIKLQEVAGISPGLWYEPADDTGSASGPSHSSDDDGDLKAASA